MGVFIVFVLGRPGCGKSTATHQMIDQVHKQQWITHHIKDYDLLYEMFRSGDPRFRPTAAYDGFNVLDFSVLDEVLSKVQKKALEKASSSGNILVTIEFARKDYQQALQFFDHSF